MRVCVHVAASEDMVTLLAKSVFPSRRVAEVPQADALKHSVLVKTALNLCSPIKDLSDVSLYLASKK